MKKLIIFLIIFVLIVASSGLIAYATVCHNGDSTPFSSVYVKSSISGTNPNTSSGSGYASAHLYNFCVFSAWRASYHTDYGYVDGYGGTGSGSHSFHSPQGWTGYWVDTSASEYCQGASAGVTAFLYGGCGT